MKDIKLSIIVPTYNHELYIEECINGILKQEVNFEYEVLIGEDCSKDNTAGVLRKMEENLPPNFTIYYRTENLGGGDFGNVDDLISRAKGEYLTVLEGDDYWIYEKKLQEQVDFLEENMEYVAVAHNCIVVDQNSVKREKGYTECKDEIYTLKHYLYDILPGQTATIMYRREYTLFHNEFVSLYKLYDFYPGDRVKAFILPLLGKVACIQQPWSAYRFVEDIGDSYSAGFRDDDVFRRNQLLFFKSQYLYARDKKRKEAIPIAGKLYFLFLFKYALRKKDFSAFLSEIIKEKRAISYCLHIIYRSMRKICKKET